jgi:hypothetical protein
MAGNGARILSLVDRVQLVSFTVQLVPPREAPLDVNKCQQEGGVEARGSRATWPKGLGGGGNDRNGRKWLECSSCRQRDRL